MSPSTLSEHIRAVEDELGGTLFDRSDGFELTPEGEVVMHIAQRMLADYGEMRRACAGVTRPPLTMRAPNYLFGLAPLLSVRERFERTHPGLSVHLRSAELQMEDPLEIVRDCSVHLACIYTVVGAGPLIQELVPRGFETFCAGTLREIIYTRAGDELSGKEVIDPQDLDGRGGLTTMCRLTEIQWAGLTEWFGNYGASVTPSYWRLGRHEDIFARKSSGGFMVWLEGYELPNTAQYADVERHLLSRDLRVSVNIVYMPSLLSPLQLEYVSCMREAAREAPIV